ncbi:MAG TPA: pseudouridine synthase [Gammaproteobacteria bacterium]|nr:pseudouridine synthase [Gammaproteobacteria bacterium]
MSERLHKVLARAGLGSRRQLEGWIAAGRVSVNGSIAQIGQAVNPGDDIHVDGRRVPAMRLAPVQLRVIGYHKPAGEICSRRDEQGRGTVFDRLPNLRGGRWLNIGRLDVATSGLLLFTTDGELAHRLMHPSSSVEREYAVRILGTVTPDMLHRLQSGVELDDGPAHFDTIIDAGGSGANHWYHVTLHEGRNREVRRLWESQGLTVSRLIRVRYGPCLLPRDQRAGRWWELEDAELNALLQIAGFPAPPPRKSRSGSRRQAAARNSPRRGRRTDPRQERREHGHDSGSKTATETSRKPGQSVGRGSHRNQRPSSKSRRPRTR